MKERGLTRFRNGCRCYPDNSKMDRTRSQAKSNRSSKTRKRKASPPKAKPRQSGRKKHVLEQRNSSSDSDIASGSGEDDLLPRSKKVPRTEQTQRASTGRGGNKNKKGRRENKGRRQEEHSFIRLGNLTKKIVGREPPDLAKIFVRSCENFSEDLTKIFARSCVFSRPILRNGSLNLST